MRKIWIFAVIAACCLGMTRIRLPVVRHKIPTQPSGRADMLMFKPTVTTKSLSTEVVIQWKYPVLQYWYQWSLESSTNLHDWVTVTNYPFGYTNDTFVTNHWEPRMFFRMHGKL